MKLFAIVLVIILICMESFCRIAAEEDRRLEDHYKDYLNNHKDDDNNSDD